MKENWSETELENLFSFVIGGDWGKDLSESDPGYKTAYCIRGSEIRDWSKDKGKTAVLRKIPIASLEKRKLQYGDILLEISGGGPDQPVGRTVFIDDDVLEFEKATPKVCTNFLRLLRLSDEVDKKFINYYLTYFYKTGEVVNYQGGSNNLRNLKFAEYSKILIPIAPLPEQKRIVAKLDNLFAHLNQLKARLQHIPTLLKQFRQAVLTQAVTGKLTEEWSTKNKTTLVDEMLQSITKPNKPSRYNSKTTSIIPGKFGLSVGKPELQIPSRYKWVELVDIARLETGHTPSRKFPEYWDPADVCWIGIKDASDHHSKTIFDTYQKTNALGLANSAARLLPQGTVCLSRTASVGYVVKMGKPMATSQDFVNWVCTDAIDPDWLKWLLVAEEESIWSFGKGTTHKTVYFPEVIAFHVALPPIEEQKEIVRRVESLFVGVDRIEASYTKLQEKIDHLPQAILSKTFRGELLKSNVDSKMKHYAAKTDEFIEELDLN